MDESLKALAVEKATIFQSGYGAGFRQFEVRHLHFSVVPLRAGGEYDAARFVERGKRKEVLLALQRLLILRGWHYPFLETMVDEESHSIVTMRRAKFSAFSPEWDVLLDEYLASNNLREHVITDGRHRPELVRRLGRPATSVRPAERSSDAIREPPNLNTEIVTTEPPASSFIEGEVHGVELDRFERDPRARTACLNHFGYRCQVCKILMSDVYGAIGERYIHVHHRIPLSDIREDYVVDPVRDMVPVCPNCHAMLHRSIPPLSVDALAQIVRRGEGAAQQDVAADGASRRR